MQPIEKLTVKESPADLLLKPVLFIIGMFSLVSFLSLI